MIIRNQISGTSSNLIKQAWGNRSISGLQLHSQLESISLTRPATGPGHRNVFVDYCLTLVFKNDLMTLQHWLSEGTNFEQTDNRGRNLLWYTIALDRIEIDQILLSAGPIMASFHCPDDLGTTPFQLICLLSQTSILNIAIQQLVNCILY